MAVITTSTTDPLKARVNVRLQQGVPIVDADWKIVSLNCRLNYVNHQRIAKDPSSILARTIWLDFAPGV